MPPQLNKYTSPIKRYTLTSSALTSGSWYENSPNFVTYPFPSSWLRIYCGGHALPSAQSRRNSSETPIITLPPPRCLQLFFFNPPSSPFLLLRRLQDLFFFWPSFAPNYVHRCLSRLTYYYFILWVLESIVGCFLTGLSVITFISLFFGSYLLVHLWTNKRFTQSVLFLFPRTIANIIWQIPKSAAARVLISNASYFHRIWKKEPTHQNWKWSETVHNQLRIVNEQKLCSHLSDGGTNFVL